VKKKDATKNIDLFGGPRKEGVKIIKKKKGGGGCKARKTAWGTGGNEGGGKSSKNGFLLGYYATFLFQAWTLGGGEKTAGQSFKGKAGHWRSK